MKLLCAVALVNAFIASTLTNETNWIKFVIDILEYKHIKMVRFCTCFERFENVKIAKTLSRNNVRSGTLNLKEATFDYSGFVIDMRCGNVTNVLQMAENLGLFRYNYKWILTDFERENLKIEEYPQSVLNSVNFRLDSDVLLAIFNGNKTSGGLYEVWSTNVNNGSMQFKMNKLGFWVDVYGINIISGKSRYGRRRNLTGTVLRGGIVHTNPIYNQTLDEYYRNLSEKNIDTISKLSYALFNHIQESHNFTYYLQLTNEWFGELPRGIDGGLGNLLHEKIVDVGIAASMIKSDRVEDYDYVFPIYPFRTCFIFRNPGRSSTVTNHFLKPFVATLWYMILISFLVIGILLYLFILIECLKLDSKDKHSWHSSFLLIWGVLCQQGAVFMPEKFASRFVLFVSLLMSLLLYNYYTSSIVSSLLNDLPSTFHTIDELTKSDLAVGMEDIVYIRILFRATNDPILQKFYRAKVLVDNKPSYLPISDGLAHIKKGGFAYHSEATTMYPIIQTEFEPYQICELAEINLFGPMTLWVVSTKHSEYTKMFAIGYNKMMESGIISRQQSLWITGKPKCLANTHLVQVALEHLLPAFLVLVLGISGSMLLLTFEILFYKVFDESNLKSKYFS